MRTASTTNNDCHDGDNNDLSTQALIAQIGLPSSMAESTLVSYRSIGIGVFGVFMRWGGMPVRYLLCFGP